MINATPVLTPSVPGSLTGFQLEHEIHAIFDDQAIVDMQDIVNLAQYETFRANLAVRTSNDTKTQQLNRGKIWEGLAEFWLNYNRRILGIELKKYTPWKDHDYGIDGEAFNTNDILILVQCKSMRRILDKNGKPVKIKNMGWNKVKGIAAQADFWGYTRKYPDLQYLYFTTYNDIEHRTRERACRDGEFRTIHHIGWDTIDDSTRGKEFWADYRAAIIAYRTALVTDETTAKTPRWFQSRAADNVDKFFAA